ncbi:Uncharacterised protein [Leminorella richardii]|uniref:Uncharacterized protein n=1 Tax=Leminorella richardii TaxID=158841 RepID=A0A2X4V6C7_9GAMM|nr:Uncharacterised protein [Leminorella richardii]
MLLYKPQARPAVDRSIFYLTPLIKAYFIVQLSTLVVNKINLGCFNTVIKHIGLNSANEDYTIRIVNHIIRIGFFTKRLF